jgi:hypothetical protein
LIRRIDFLGSELDACEIIFWALVVSGGDGTKVFEFVEEALDEVSVAIRHRLDIGPRTTGGKRAAQRVGVVGAIS